jgi:hypothetical protein
MLWHWGGGGSMHFSPSPTFFLSRSPVTFIFVDLTTQILRIFQY